MNHGEQFAYPFTLSLLSLSLIAFLSALLFLCRKTMLLQSSDDNPSIKTSLKLFSLSNIDAATDGFSPQRILGKGRLGTTYAAVLEGGELVAIKRIHPGLVLSNPGLGFQPKIKALSSAQHPNLVPVLGFSEGPGERIIVSEFVGPTSLEFYLHQNPDGLTLLNWSQRLKITCGIARGIEYLHEKMAPHVVHGCIKPSNIMIDAKLCPRLCDYGLGFLGPKEGKVGLMGYVDEEYWGPKVGSGPSKASDVYGFGVVALEMLTGRRSEGGRLLTWAVPLIREIKIREVVDPRVRVVGTNEMASLARLAKVALACVGNCRKTRPSISQIVSILDNFRGLDC